jgi:flagellar hook-length control protein FliK
MTTTPVGNTASSASSSSAGRSNASRKADSAGNPFQQMLSEKIAGKASVGNSAHERAAYATASNKPASSTSGEKPVDSAASAADKIRRAADKAAREENSDESNTSALSPELAAMVARLLQQQSAAADETAADAGTSDQADPLATLTQTLQGKSGEAQTMKSELSALDDPKLAAAGKSAQDALQANGQSASALDLQAAAGAELAEGEEGGQTTEFSNVLQQLNQTAQAGQARHAQSAPHLAPKVGASGWDQALGQRVIWMASGAEHSASLTLNPPELGPLQVVLNVSNNHANATFVAPHAEVRQALEAAMPKLREMLGEAGIQLDQASVNQGAPQQQGEFARSDGGSGSRGQGRSQNGPEQTIAEPAVSRRVTASGNGLVDTFA